MLSTGTPLADRTETKVCLISRGAQSFPSPAFSVIVVNARITLFALSGVPTVDEKTRPWSRHSSRPEHSRPEQCPSIAPRAGFEPATYCLGVLLRSSLDHDS